MAKFKITANAEIDLLTKAEVAEIFAAWRLELARGVKFRNFTASTTTATAAYTIDGGIGPAAGMAWSVMRLYVSGAGVTAGTDLFSVFVNDASASLLVRSGLTRGGEWGEGGFVLNPNDKIIVAGATTGTASAPIVMSGQAIEVPVQLIHTFA